MHDRKATRSIAAAWLVPLATLVLFLTGCTTAFQTVANQGITASGSTSGWTGRVLHGQASVSHASIQLYAAGTVGYGSSAIPLLATPVISDANGNFTLPKTIACPSADAPVYLAAAGGDGGAGYNGGLLFLSVLGGCSQVGMGATVLNELTTVAAVYALAPFMQSPLKLGASASNQAGLANAFATAARLVDSTTGLPASPLPAGTTLPVAAMNTLASILAACANTVGGLAGDSTPCGRLFAQATTWGAASPTDTASALLAIASHPARNVLPLLALVPTAPAFMPVSRTLHDLSLAIRYTPPLKQPSAAAIDASGNLWITNVGDGSISIVSNAGVALSSPARPAELLHPSAIAFDGNGTAWITDSAGATLTALRQDGTSMTTQVAGLSAPAGIAVDAQGMLWVANKGNNSVTAVTVNGTAVQGAQSYQPAGLTAPHAIAINPF